MANPFVFWWGWGGYVVRTRKCYLGSGFFQWISNLRMPTCFSGGRTTNSATRPVFGAFGVNRLAAVPKKGQVADGPTGGALPSCVFSEKDNWLFIRPTWFAGVRALLLTFPPKQGLGGKEGGGGNRHTKPTQHPGAPF